MSLDKGVVIDINFLDGSQSESPQPAYSYHNAQLKILCRGKRVDNGEWIIGYVYRLNENLNPFIMLFDGHGVSYEVDPSTIGQCTGIQDARDNLIFVGDLVSPIHKWMNEEHGESVGIVKFGKYNGFCRDEIGFYVDWISASKWRHDLGFWEDEKSLVIIGNIDKSLKNTGKRRIPNDT